MQHALTGSLDRLSGQAALVTGASGGIGAAITEALVAAGARVGLVGRRQRPLQGLVRKVGAGDALALTADLTSDRELGEVVRAFLQWAGRLDVLVHSNGTYKSGTVESASVVDFDRLWAANVRSPYLLTQRLLPELRKTSGQIVFVNSSIGLDTRAGVSQYSATQHALRAVADTLRAEVNPNGIRVVSLYPGRTATKRQERITKAEGRVYEPDKLLQPADVASVVVETLSLPRTAEITDVRIRPLQKP